jgi:hypothetical protein
VVSEWESLKKKQQKLYIKKSEIFVKIFWLKKKQEALNNKKQKMITIGLNSLNELDTLEELEQKEYKEETRRET